MRQISFVSGMKTQFFPSESQSHSSGEKQTFFDLDKGVSGWFFVTRGWGDSEEV